jgi:Xaa-Pro aminopeptidase
VTDFSRRRSAVFEALAAGSEADALLVTTPANVRYLCGFTGSNGWLLLTAGEAVLLTDPRYAEQAGAEVVDARVEVSGRGLVTLLGAVLPAIGPVRPAFEADHVTVALRGKLEAAGELDWTATSGLVEGVRCCKEAAEIAAVRAALQLTEGVLLEVAQKITPGQAETEIAGALEHACRRRGAARMAFDTIVAGGPRSALPHGVATSRIVGAGEPLMIDMGCVLDGYCSDITRMLWVGGTPDPAWIELHDVVDRARRAALEAVRPGVACREVDAAARSVIAAAGHANRFTHGTGHGVGLQVHEGPTVSSRSDDVLEAGMVVTIEPAVYVRGAHGIRIEDLVAVTEDGCDRLTALGTEPILRGIP